jgi:flagellar basal-body rod modification protein FlgD
MATDVVDPIAAYSAQTQAAAATKAKKKTELGSSDFMTLMITQLKNQDPMKPQDPSEFLGQLAQFSTVSGIQNMQASMTELAGSMRSAQVLNGASLVGREILASSTKANLLTGGHVNGAVDIPNAVKDAQLSIKDSTGQLIRKIDLKDSGDGLTEFTWDGLTSTGQPAAPGSYEFEITAKSGDETYSFDPLLTSKVASVTIDPTRGDLILNTDIGPVAISDVQRVK